METTALSGASDMSLFGHVVSTAIFDRSCKSGALGRTDLRFKEWEEMPCPSCHSRSEANDVAEM